MCLSVGKSHRRIRVRVILLVVVVLERVVVVLGYVRCMMWTRTDAIGIVGKKITTIKRRRRDVAALLGHRAPRLTAHGRTKRKGSHTLSQEKRTTLRVELSSKQDDLRWSGSEV